MAKFCSEDCAMIGGICDFCKNFKENITGTYDGDESICLITNKKVFASDGANCNNFECYNIKYIQDK